MQDTISFNDKKISLGLNIVGNGVMWVHTLVIFGYLNGEVFTFMSLTITKKKKTPAATR